VQWRVCCFKKIWIKYLLTKMNFVKRKATTKKPKFSVSNFEELKSQFLMNIMASVTMEEILSDMVLNWDQMAIKYIPLSDWTIHLAAIGFTILNLTSTGSISLPELFCGAMLSAYQFSNLFQRNCLAAQFTLTSSG